MTSPQQPPEPVVDETLTPLEAAFYTLLLAAFTRWLTKVAGSVMRPWRLWRMAPDPQGVWAQVDTWSAEVNELINFLGDRAARHGWDRAPGDLTFVSTDSFIQAHLAKVKNYLVRIPDEVAHGVFAEISEGVNAGESTEQIAERVEKFLNVSGSENWPNRAQVIAVTETNGASSAGWFAAAAQSQRLLGPLNKRWIATHDRSTRLAHREADGQVRPLLQPFIVDGEPLQYPGDKTGSPSNVINCRCSATTTGGA